MSKRLFSAGDCPVCSDSGALLYLRRADRLEFFFYCPLCGLAWRNSPPRRGMVDTMEGVTDVAPDGVAVPTSEEVVSCPFLLREVDGRDWWDLFRWELQRLGVPLAGEAEQA